MVMCTRSQLQINRGKNCCKQFTAPLTKKSLHGTCKFYYVQRVYQALSLIFNPGKTYIKMVGTHLCFALQVLTWQKLQMPDLLLLKTIMEYRKLFPKFPQKGHILISVACGTYVLININAFCL